jgi:hypothetical protein
MKAHYSLIIANIPSDVKGNGRLSQRTYCQSTQVSLRRTSINRRRQQKRFSRKVSFLHYTSLVTFLCRLMVHIFQLELLDEEIPEKKSEEKKVFFHYNSCTLTFCRKRQKRKRILNLVKHQHLTKLERMLLSSQMTEIGNSFTLHEIYY